MGFSTNFQKKQKKDKLKQLFIVVLAEDRYCYAVGKLLLGSNRHNLK
tara:strand:+ start:181 stop:321 length:141 start_codon:yes stop_codon:yes gene_type:complete